MFGESNYKNCFCYDNCDCGANSFGFVKGGVEGEGEGGEEGEGEGERLGCLERITTRIVSVMTTVTVVRTPLDL